MKKTLALLLVFTVTAVYSRPAQAMLAPIDSPAIIAADRAADLKTVQTFLEQKQVRAHLSKMGLSESEIAPRLSSLSDTELHRVAQNIEKQQPAGDGGGLVITVLVIGILVLLFVYLFKRV